MIRSLRDEALLILEGRGAILDIARDVTRIMRESNLEGAIIGGVAVVLHGHIRTTVDVEVFVPESTELLAQALESAGYTFNRDRKEFIKNNVPVHFVLPEQAGARLSEFVEVEGIRTVGLADLVNSKLASGTRDPLRAQDLADVIGLVQHHRLTGEFAPKIDESLRGEFRKLAQAVNDRG